MAGSIRKQGKQSWGIQVELGRDPVSKRRRFYRFTVRGTKQDAERELTAALSKRDTGIDLVPAKITVAEYMRRWLRDSAQHRVSASTFERYTGIVEGHIIPALGSKRLMDLRPIDIQAAYAKWQAPGSRRDGRSGALSARTVHHHHRVLSEALRQAVRCQMLTRNPCEAVDPPRPQRTEMRALDVPDVRCLLEAAKNEPLEALIHCAVSTGARIGELLALRWEDIDLESGQLTIARTVRKVKDKGFVFGTPKTHRSRRAIALDAQTVVVLLEHRRRQIEQRLLVGPAYRDAGLVFATATGQPVGYSTARSTFHRVLARAGLTRMGLYGLRHTMATLMLKPGVPTKDVSGRLGHSNVAITLDTYAHSLPDMRRDAAEKLAEMIRGTGT